MVNDMAGCQFLCDVVYGNAHLYHKHHDMVAKIGYLVNGFLFVIGLCGDYYLGRFLSDLFKYFVYAFLKEVRCVRPIFFIYLFALDELHKSLVGKIVNIIIFIYKVIKA